MEFWHKGHTPFYGFWYKLPEYHCPTGKIEQVVILLGGFPNDFVFLHCQIKCRSAVPQPKLLGTFSFGINNFFDFQKLTWCKCLLFPQHSKQSLGKQFIIKHVTIYATKMMWFALKGTNKEYFISDSTVLLPECPSQVTFWCQMSYRSQFLELLNFWICRKSTGALLF